MAEDSSPLRVVLDTNVWISGIFFRRGLPAKILAQWRDGRFELIVTQETLGELSQKLQQKASQFGAQPDLAHDWLAYIERYAIKVKASGNVIGVCRDPADDIFLDAATSGDASLLVTGDKDLLTIKAYQSIRILSPRDFWNMIT